MFPFLFILTVLNISLLAYEADNTISAVAPKAPLGLPPIPWPKDNPYTAEKAHLGKLLYFDKRLSSDSTVSCASCHYADAAYSDHSPVSEGIDNQKGTRNSPTVINTAYLSHLFWDGSANSLEEQAKGPIANTKEMSSLSDPHEAHSACHKKIKNIVGYRALFKEAFGTGDCTIDEIAMAIATFERTILSGNSPFDRYMSGNKTAMTPEAIKGYEVFKESGCISCHGTQLIGGEFANIGIGMDVQNPDLGRYEITKIEEDKGRFKVPMLREVAQTYPYMHDGSLASLEDVIEYYNKGGTPNPYLSPLIRPLYLSEEEKKCLKTFLEALSGEGWQHVQEPEIFP